MVRRVKLIQDPAVTSEGDRMREIRGRARRRYSHLAQIIEGRQRGLHLGLRRVVGQWRRALGVRILVDEFQAIGPLRWRAGNRNRLDAGGSHIYLSGTPRNDPSIRDIG